MQDEQRATLPILSVPANDARTAFHVTCQWCKQPLVEPSQFMIPVHDDCHATMMRTIFGVVPEKEQQPHER